MSTPQRSSPDPRKTARVNVRLSAVVREKLDGLSAATSLPPSEVVRWLIEQATPWYIR